MPDPVESRTILDKDATIFIQCIQPLLLPQGCLFLAVLLSNTNHKTLLDWRNFVVTLP